MCLCHGLLSGSLSVSLCLSVCLSRSLPVCLPVCLALCLSACFSVCTSVFVLLYLSVCVPVSPHILSSVFMPPRCCSLGYEMDSSGLIDPWFPSYSLSSAFLAINLDVKHPGASTLYDVTTCKVEQPCARSTFVIERSATLFGCRYMHAGGMQQPAGPCVMSQDLFKVPQHTACVFPLLFSVPVTFSHVCAFHLPTSWTAESSIPQIRRSWCMLLRVSRMSCTLGRRSIWWPALSCLLNQSVPSFFSAPLTMVWKLHRAPLNACRWVGQLYLRSESQGVNSFALQSHFQEVAMGLRPNWNAAWKLQHPDPTYRVEMEGEPVTVCPDPLVPLNPTSLPPCGRA